MENKKEMTTPNVSAATDTEQPFPKCTDHSIPAEKENKSIGLWGHRHKRYLQEHKRATYTTLLTSGKLDSYLADIDKQAEDMFLRLVEQMTEREGVTEQLKAENQMEWVGAMNNIRHRATEIVNTELIFV